jgi:hypothetical protein
VTDAALRVLGGLLALGGGLLTAVLAVLLAPLRVGSFGGLIATVVGWGPDWLAPIRLPVAIALVPAAAWFLTWFASRATGVRWAVLLPGLGWFAMVAVALFTTSEGDRLLLPDDWVATITLFAGTVTLVVTAVLGLTRAPAESSYHSGS